MKITKKGCIVPFDCTSCESEFIAGINAVVVQDGNFYAECPLCKSECHTDYGRMNRNDSYDIAMFLGERIKAQKGDEDAD